MADFHLGYSVGYKMMEKMEDIINKEDVDLVLIAGDIFDNSYDSLDKPSRIKNSLKNIKSKYGKYAVFGNHDVDEKLFAGFSIGSSKKAFRDDRMNNMLKDAGIKILDDEVEEIKDYIKTKNDDRCTFFVWLYGMKFKRLMTDHFTFFKNIGRIIRTDAYFTAFNINKFPTRMTLT